MLFMHVFYEYNEAAIEMVKGQVKSNTCEM